MKKKLLMSVLSMSSVLAMMASCTIAPSSSGTNPSNGGTSSSQILLDDNNWEVVSPNGKLRSHIRLVEDDNSIVYSVVKNDGKKDVAVVNESKLGFVLEEEDLSSMLTFEYAEYNNINTSYTNITGRHSYVEDKCSEVKIVFSGYSYYITITMRAYDDGYAFKYDIDAANEDAPTTFNVLEESTQFNIPTGSISYVQPYKTCLSSGDFFAYEEPFERKKVDNLYGKKVSMPMIYNVRGTDTYSLITESGLIGSEFYGTYLESYEEDSSILRTVHTPASAKELDEEKEYEFSYPFSSPWRVGITGSLKEVTESELVEKVYDDVEYWRPDNYDELSDAEKEIYDYEWVEPGVTAWNWLIYSGKVAQNDFSLQRKYVDLAAEMGWKYTILDGGWDSGFSASNFTEFMNYANEKNVKVLVWCNGLASFNNGNKTMLTSQLDTWARYGVAGIKIDFFDGQNANGMQTHQGEDKGTISWYETIYQECAKRKMVVNCHGSNKPTGERRVYPNVINREAVKGNEFKAVDAGTIVNSMFTRMIVGPADFTPVVDPLSDGMTIGSQMAASFLYESGSPSMADYETTYRRSNINGFYKALPSVWDEDEFLGGNLDEYFAMARKSDNDWFVGAINSVTPRQIDIDFSFLDEEATYRAEIYLDGNNKSDLVVQSETITKETKKSFNLKVNGGFAIRLVKQK